MFIPLCKHDSYYSHLRSFFPLWEVITDAPLISNLCRSPKHPSSSLLLKHQLKIRQRNESVCWPGQSCSPQGRNCLLGIPAKWSHGGFWTQLQAPTLHRKGTGQDFEARPRKGKKLHTEQRTSKRNGPYRTYSSYGSVFFMIVSFNNWMYFAIKEVLYRSLLLFQQQLCVQRGLISKGMQADSLIEYWSMLVN